MKFVKFLFAFTVVLGLTAACSSADKTSCTDTIVACGNGKAQACVTSDSSGACKSTYYKAPDGKQFNWASCTDGMAAVTDTNAYCASLSGGGMMDAGTD